MKNQRINKTVISLVGEMSVVLLVLLSFSACGTGSQSRISDNLKHLAKGQTVAILPVEIADRGQKEAAAMFRRSLYANLVQAQFKVQERYLVDGLLKQAGITDSSQYRKVGIARLGEILGVDAIVFSKIENVDRLYLIIHSSINMAVSAEMIDTRTGETLWQGKETASEFTGIAKIPTGMFAAVSAPLYFVTNKLNLRHMTTEMTGKMTSIIKKPEEESGLAVDKSKSKAANSKWTIPRQNERVELAQLSRSKENKMADPATRVKKAKNADDKPRVQSVAKENTGEEPTFFYTLQVGAYKTREYAENMIHSLAGKGYNAFMSMLENGNSTMYKVQVERFDDADKARIFSKELESREHIQALTLKINTN